jgi:DDE superfamily endonuclease
MLSLPEDFVVKKMLLWIQSIECCRQFRSRCSTLLFDHCANQRSLQQVTCVLIFSGISCQQFPQVALIVDCSFQISNRAGASFEERKLYFSGKHHQYGIKRELAHMPNGKIRHFILGMVAFVSEPHPGAKHDFSVFQESIAKYQEFLEKRPGEEHIEDPDQGQDRWALLADKGYVGAGAYVRALIPKKTTSNNPLSIEDLASNHVLSSSRVICENFYGRMKTLFKICTDRYRGKQQGLI